MSSFQGVLVRGVPQRCPFIEVSCLLRWPHFRVSWLEGFLLSCLLRCLHSFQGVLIRGVPVVLFIEVFSFQVTSFQGVLIRGVPAVLFIEVTSFQGVLIEGFLLSCLLR